MKILSAWIKDPSLEGHLSPPLLAVEVDEPPGVTIPPEDFAGGWKVGKYGPFVSYEQEGAKPSAGDFNVRFRGRFPVVVDILLLTPEFEYDCYSIPLSRARQLIRKHDPRWRLLISDREGEQGRITWIPVETDSPCRYWLPEKKTTCGAKPSRLIRVRSIDLPMCAQHVEIHNQAYAERRTSRAS